MRAVLFLLLLSSAAMGAPPVTDAERAAAFPDVSGTPMHEHMESDPLLAMLRVDELEWQGHSGDDTLHWDVTGWLGNDRNRLWLRDEGAKDFGSTAHNRLELLWGRPVASWWDMTLGVRADTGPGENRNYAAFGVQGLAPQWVHVEATAYAGEGGQVGLRLQGDYDWLFTNQLILSARLEGDAWSDDDEEAGIGSGISDVAAGLRLRYEIRREFAPYVGVEWRGSYGETADLARDSGEDTRVTSLVAGLRFWF